MAPSNICESSPRPSVGTLELTAQRPYRTSMASNASAFPPLSPSGRTSGRVTRPTAQSPGSTYAHAVTSPRRVQRVATPRPSPNASRNVHLSLPPADAVPAPALLAPVFKKPSPPKNQHSHKSARTTLTGSTDATAARVPKRVPKGRARKQPGTADTVRPTSPSPLSLGQSGF